MIREQSYVVLEQFQKVSLFVQEQGNAGLFNIEHGNGYAGFLEPQEAVLIHIELGVLIQVLQDETLVLCVEFGGDEIEHFIQVQLVVFIVSGDIAFVDFDDCALLGHHVLHVLCLDVFPNGCRHSADNQIQIEYRHHLVVNYSVDRLSFFK